MQPIKGFAIIGAGNVGSLVARVLAAEGYRFTGCFDLVRERAIHLCRCIDEGINPTTPGQAGLDADIIFLTVSDDSLVTLATSIAGETPDLRGKIYIHTSGLHPAAVMKPLKDAGAFILSFHPCISISADSEDIAGAMIALEGDTEAIASGRELALAMRCSSMTISAADKPLYHLAASLLSNFLVVFSDIARELYHSIGLTPGQTLGCIGPLLQSTVRNIERRGIGEALTGPFARGDRGTILHHLQLIQSLQSPARDLLLSFFEHARLVASKNGYLDEKSACLLKEDIERVRLVLQAEQLR